MCIGASRGIKSAQVTHKANRPRTGCDLPMMSGPAMPPAPDTKSYLPARRQMIHTLADS